MSTLCHCKVGFLDNNDLPKSHGHMLPLQIVHINLVLLLTLISVPLHFVLGAGPRDPVGCPAIYGSGGVVADRVRLERDRNTRGLLGAREWSSRH